MCRALQVSKVFQGIRVLRVLQAPQVHLSLDNQDPRVPQDLKVCDVNITDPSKDQTSALTPSVMCLLVLLQGLQVVLDLQVNLAPTVKNQSQVLMEIPVFQDQMESQVRS